MYESCRRFSKENESNYNFNYKDVLEKFGGTTIKCYLTGKEIDLTKDKYELDHIIPVSKGGSNTLDNLGITIPLANSSKSSMTVEEYLEMCKTVLTNFGYTVSKV
mgnify:CR=1 FL=1